MPIKYIAKIESISNMQLNKFFINNNGIFDNNEEDKAFFENYEEAKSTAFKAISVKQISFCFSIEAIFIPS